jgi:PadR family transcriptional regulator, regulatory protein AphA
LSTSGRELTTTSYAILGLLALQPWSTYELAKQMRRNFHFFWPRAESNLYAEPKRLVSGGWARAKSGANGQRRRTVYSITSQGRRALEQWLTEPAMPARFEAEPIVKFAFAPNSTKEHMVANLRRFRADAETRQTQLRAIFEEYLRNEDQFPERLHINVVAYRLLWDLAETESAWASWALDRTKSWPDTKKPKERATFMRILKDRLEGA